MFEMVRHGAALLSAYDKTNDITTGQGNAAQREWPQAPHCSGRPEKAKQQRQALGESSGLLLDVLPAYALYKFRYSEGVTPSNRRNIRVNVVRLNIPTSSMI